MSNRLLPLAVLSLLLLPFLAAGRRGAPADFRDAPNSGSAADQLSAATGGAANNIPISSPVTAGKSIIGDDDRMEYYEAPAEIRALADSVVAVMRVTPQAAVGPPLCPSERFYGQPTDAFCTGFLVAPDIVATSGHCISARSCADRKFVFGYAVKRAGRMPRPAQEEDTYYCGEVLVSTYTAKSRADDYALVRLDRPVAGHIPLALNLSGGVPAEGTKVFTIGHFLGYPVKIAGNSIITRSRLISGETGGRWFAATLDIYPGNSGGPVINQDTLQVEGILARGGGDTGEDFDVTPAGCKVSRMYPARSLWGPEVVNVSVLLPYFRRFARP
jgi:V8-like Glu-specific endopeptidase